MVILCLPLLTALSNINSFLDLQRFINSSIAPFISLLEYLDLLIIKKLFNLDRFARCRHDVCYSQYSRIFLVSLSNLLITIMLMNFNRLVVVAVIVYLSLQSLYALSYCCCLPRFVVANFLVLLLMSARLIELTLVER